MDKKPLRGHRTFLIALLILVPVLFLIGWSQASLNLSFIHPRSARETLLLDAVSAFVFVLFVVFALILFRILLKLYAERRENRLGSRFKTKMVVAFLALSLVPVCFLFLFSYGLINRSIDKWFGFPLDTVRRDATAIADELSLQSSQAALASAQRLALLPRVQQRLAAGDQAGLARSLQRAARVMGLESVLCLDRSGALVARAGNPFPDLPRVLQFFPAAARGRVPASGLRASLRSADSELFLGAERVQDAAGRDLGSVITISRLPLNIQNMASQIQQESLRYDQLSEARKSMKRVYLSILLLITLLILFAATWLAMFFSKQVTVPVEALAQATHEVSRGNLDCRITTRADAELGSLIRLFNEMTFQLAESRLAIERAAADLQGANRELEERSNTMEAILENVPVGVISLNPHGEITRMNSTTGRILGNGSVTTGQALTQLFAPEDAREISRLFRRAQRQGVVSRQLTLNLAERRVLVGVTVSSVSAQHGAVGFVVVIEDLTDVAQAQRSAAWREVAQRIAHEIKNPLTPIRLSADRILRLLAKPDVAPARLVSAVSESTSLIERETATLEALVDEFSRFARFPTSQPVPADVNQIIENALRVFDGRLSEIRLIRDLAPSLPTIRVDPEQMKRAVINLVDNAAEALERSAVKEIWVRSRFDPDREIVSVMVADSGPGIPPAAKERLFLPYFSTKQRGTGLGLAIVSRIVSEHHGAIRVEENRPLGSQFVIELPLEYSAAVSS